MGEGGNLNVQIGGAFHEGRRHFSKTPLISTYKRRPSPPHYNTTRKKSYHT